jgi:DNA-binding NtrC family response regulator
MLGSSPIIERGAPVVHLLLIDDDPALIPKQLRQAFPEPAHVVEIAKSGAKGLAAIRNNPPDVILLDLRLPDQSGLEVYQKIRAIDARIPVIFVTVAKSADVAIKAMQEGAFDYLFKPLDLQQLWQVVTYAVEVARRMRQPAVMSELLPDPDFNGAIVGTCSSMREVYKAIGRVASQNDPVLITGETGTGKELVACALYHHSPRAKSPFLALNCAAIPENLLESELFGHEKGAFTGADRRRIGKFEQCNGGTLFLDEIGDMPLALQAKLLRLLQDQTFERVGGNETIQTDVRLIAATNHDLKQLSAIGKFRPDLYYRLSVFTVHLPALRNRGNDLQLLAQLFLRRFSPELGRNVCEVAPATLSRLRKYSWPGNVRELQSVLKQALLLSSGEVLLPEFLPADLFGQSPEGRDASLTSRRFDSGKSLADLECDAIQESLLETGGNRQQTAERLGISTRTLLRKIRQYSLDDPLHKPAATSDEGQ